MTDALDAFGHFFSGDGTATSLSGSWQCVEDSVDLFAKKVRGDNAGYWRARELASFMESHFLQPGERINDQLLAEIMHLKQMLIGGADDRITRDEIVAIHELARNLKTLMVAILPDMKIYSGNWLASGNHAADKAELAAAEIGFSKNIKNLWPPMRAAYDLKNLQALADGLKASFPNSSRLTRFQSSMAKYLPLVLSAKNILLNDKTSVIGTSDWPRPLTTLPMLYSRYMYFTYFLDNGLSWFWKTSLPDLDQWVHDVLVNLQSVLQGRGSSAPGVTVIELNGLIDALATSGFLGDTMTPSSIKDLIPILIKRALSPPAARIAGKSETTLSQTCLNIFKTEFEIMMLVQRKLDTLLNQQPTWTHAQLQAAFQTPFQNEEEFARILQSPKSFALDDKGRMYINVTGEIPYGPDALLRMNLVRAFVRIGIMSYAKDMTRVAALSSLTKDEVVTDLWNEMRQVLIDAAIIEPDNTTFASNRFVEANLFTPMANGDKTLDFFEAAGIGQMMWSGIKLNAGFTDAIKNACAVAPTNAIYNVPCAMEQMRKDIPSVATSLPLMTTLFQSMPQAQGDDMLTQLLKAAGWVPNTANTAKMSDIGLNPHVLQYIEAIYRRWDTNKDGILDKTEAMIAEPTFRQLLADVSGQTDPGLLRAGFAYVLVYQKNPADNLFDFLFFFANDESKWKINVDRPKIAGILGFIADQMRGKSLRWNLLSQ